MFYAVELIGKERATFLVPIPFVLYIFFRYSSLKEKKDRVNRF